MIKTFTKAGSKQVPMVNIGLIGLGTVGSGVLKIIEAERAAIEDRAGVRLVLKRVCDKFLSKERQKKLPKGLFTRQADEVLNDPEINILVELIGGIHPAREIILSAFAQGKHVVTANKALLAEQGDAIFLAAARQGRLLGFEASVCGAIPIIQAVRQGLASNNVSHFLGIVNGTCNYILTQMSQKGVELDVALEDAQKKGYAERNPKLDIGGFDSAHKLAVLARQAFQASVDYKAVSIEGIENLSARDIEYARGLGYVVKLLAVGKKLPKGLELRVHPTLLASSHPLATVNDVYNAVFVHADQAGDLLFYGKGAGMLPAASAVMADVIEIARCAAYGGPRSMLEKVKEQPVLPTERIVSRYYLRFQAVDRPGVLGMIARTLGENGISILSVHQKEPHNLKSVPVVILTHRAPEKNLRKALAFIDRQKAIAEPTVVLRVEG